jgi:ethanolamine utilization cobalamin adenosyltransferase
MDHILHMRDNWVLAQKSLERRSSYLTGNENKLLKDLQTVIAFINNHLEKDFIDIDIERSAK